MMKGCSGLKVLEIKGSSVFQTLRLPDLFHLPSSGACEGLEDLKLESCEMTNFAHDSLKEWLMRTKQARPLASIPSVSIG